MFRKNFLFIAIWLMFTALGKSQDTTEVLLVLGSDTALWDGMGTDSFHDHYNPQLYVDPSQNSYKVMDAAWRQKIKDSYGSTVKLTWWMMTGNILRYADNINMPVPNIMCLYYMKKYHTDAIKQFGDEISMHYHTFNWTDYNGDGLYFWNQAKSFSECKSDFDYSLSQYLLEESTFPVSFRSGWHYMDNGWQNYLDGILPYSMDDAYPDKRYVTSEPIDNVFDWSLSSSHFVPFHPSRTNYQLPGSCKGWNVRCIYMANVTAAIMGQIFSEANKGNTQVACMWAHLPEDTYLANVQHVDSLAHLIAKQYPKVKFRYCTAVEAMQRYTKTADTIAPQVAFSEKKSGNDVTFEIKTDEPIFQEQPFVAIKDIYERYINVPCKLTGINTWQTTQSYPASIIAKAAVALTDTVGNQSKAFINYLPDDIYIDDQDPTYAEVRGTWTSSASYDYWGNSLKTAIVKAGDSAIVDWKPTIAKAGIYNIFYQTQQTTAPVPEYTFLIYTNNIPVDTITIKNSIPAKKWFYTATESLEPGSFIRAIYRNTTSQNATAFADVIKISSLVKDKQLVAPDVFINMGTYTEFDTAVTCKVKLNNIGRQSLNIQSITSKTGAIASATKTPVTVQAQENFEALIKLNKYALGKYMDTLVVTIDDSLAPALEIPCYVTIDKYFDIVDNEDVLRYQESGKWYYSNGFAYGSTSRYSFTSDAAGSFASYKAKVKKTGSYEFYELLPANTNSATHALYQIKVNSKLVNSKYLDQNTNSGNWILFGNAYMLNGDSVEVKVINDGSLSGSKAGDVIRADAIKFSFVNSTNEVENSSSSPMCYSLGQNYPNPFNPSTTIAFTLGKNGNTTLKVFDILGRCVTTLVDGYLSSGKHQLTFNADTFSSGIYFVKLQSGSFSKTIKIMLLK
jgi:hypothetical protein